jgi:hypothetical protein
LTCRDSRDGFKEGFGLAGEVEILVFDKDGKLKKRIVLKNLITNVGYAQVAGLINGVVTTPFKYVAVGAGSSTSPGTCTDPSATDTALGYEVARVLATTGRTTTSVPNDTATWSATFNFTASYPLCEAGIFDTSTGGNMLSRVTYAVVNVASGDTMVINWKIQAKAGS